MGNVANSLKPPYYAAIISDNENHVSKSEHGVPTDELVSIALHQPGFLGLEMTRNHGRQVPVSYWKNIKDVERWKDSASKTIAKKYNGAKLDETCSVQVSMVKRMFLINRSIPTN